MKKILVFGFCALCALTISAQNLSTHTNSPQNRLSPEISDDGSVVTEYLRKETPPSADLTHSGVVEINLPKDSKIERLEIPPKSEIYEKVVAEEELIKPAASSVEFEVNSPQNRLHPKISEDGSQIIEYLRK